MDKKKVGILNFYDTKANYGAVLQALALQEIVKNLGCDVEHIRLFRPTRDVSLLRFLYRKLKHKLAVLQKKSYSVRHSQVFEQFRNDYINSSKNKLRSVKAILSANFDYSAVIVGSDQVWRPKYTKEFVYVYFLSFVKSEVKKIAYAASFGVDHWEETSNNQLTSQIKNLVQKFTAVSVREDSGVQICTQVFDTKATHVLDPTLVIGADFFKSIADKLPPKNIVYYKLDQDNDFKNLIAYLTERTDGAAEDIYYKYETERMRSYHTVNYWIGALLSSKIIVTDSFHCICFAIMFNKEFIYYGNKIRGLARVESLLRLLGISLDRIIDSFDIEICSKLLNEKIDYDSVNKKVNSLRSHSINFLENSLKSNEDE